MKRPPPVETRTGVILAVVDTVIIAGIVIALLWRAVPDANRELVSAVVGFVAGWVTAARNFYYGSSSGAEQKNRALADQASALASAAPAAAAAALAQGGAAGGTMQAEGELTLTPSAGRGSQGGSDE